MSAQGKPEFTSTTGVHALSPGDYWVIYNATPSYDLISPPSIAVVGRSNINSQDVYLFQQYFLDSFQVPQVIVNGPDPGDLGAAEEAEAVLDSSWVMSGDPLAKIYLVVSETTNTTDGVDLSEEYIIDRNLADVMTESFGQCEIDFTQAEAAFYSSLAEQAAAQGITYLVAAGDSGSSGCNSGSDTSSNGILSVNQLAANPYVTAVGGTMFNENGNDSAYWSSTNTSTNVANYVSALSYIPENAWNESCTAGGVSNPCSIGNTPGLWAGGGGASGFYAKPDWQTGVPGIPNDGLRDVPDVSLTAAGHDPYLICLAGSCQPNELGEISFYGYAGTSAATPSFAGFVAGLVDSTGGRRLGSINPLLYQIAAAQTFAACNGSDTAAPPARACVFNDVTVGNNSVPGESGYNTAAGNYQGRVGYDLATGLGSVNLTNLKQAIQALSAGNPVLSYSPQSLNFGNVLIGSSKTLTIPISNTGTGALRIYALEAGNEFSISGCEVLVLPGQSCNLNVVFTPVDNWSGMSGYASWVANTPSMYYGVDLTGSGVSTPTATISLSSLNFGSQNVLTRSVAQTINITNSTVNNFDAGIVSMTGDLTDFNIANQCGSILYSGASCNISVIFSPLLAGVKYTALIIPTSVNAGQTAITLSGTATLTGTFELFNARTGQVLEVSGGSTSNGALIQQNLANGALQQQWKLIPIGNAAYEIASALNEKALDIIEASTADGARIQQYEYLAGMNQQWQLTAVDDVHYAITNVNSGKALDVPLGTSTPETAIQQWDYVGDPQQLWILVPATMYNIVNNWSGNVLEFVSASTSDSAPIEQATPDGLLDQQWQFVPVGGGFYTIFNLNSGRVLDDTAGSGADGNIMQQFDFFYADPNQQWSLLPLDTTNYKIVNRSSGKVLDDTGYSNASGTLIQQWDYLGGNNQRWQLTPVTYYNIVNRLSGFVLDIPGGSTADGESIQQWASDGDLQQQWQIVNIGSGVSVILNNSTGKALQVSDSSTSDGALIQQGTYLGGLNQQWQLMPVTAGNPFSGTYYQIRNINSEKVLDVMGASLLNGALFNSTTTWAVRTSSGKSFRSITDFLVRYKS